MVIFVATKEGFKELEEIIRTGKYPVWVGAGVLSKEEMAEVREGGVYLTNFLYPIDLNDAEIVSDALESIALHHPEERVWLECIP
ncbi:hypothetical protein ACONUD_16995 [Microbulbifer harenosus]|uniref:Uncharacterized protein n=1 Tax=Microbulbifer harenosus TaxID=2576840 RepID=A0ABY2UCL3_9GAMM|nr:hypothetical protein [Microbulbifer harenosus]TLM73400.1 hypothetical protein FDY93_19030 [Microbulbifer harenosus]